MSEYDYGVLLADAYRLAAELHRNQEDKSGAPYIQHVVSVAVAVHSHCYADHMLNVGCTTFILLISMELSRQTIGISQQHSIIIL